LRKNVKLKMIAGIVLILLGAFALYNRGIPYSKKEEVLKIGTMKAQVETKETYEIHPAISGLVLAGGIVLLIYSVRKPS
jgi:Na+/H+ antiporter NhaC